MSQSQHERRRPDDDGEPDAGAAAQARPQQSESDEEFDDLLDEIDGVLEVNAEEFVRSFVQKGGQ
ncbi:ubiquitin-like protein Pup [Enemella evansiae]|uniref:ubiquitin-like protein Pup n=1 Tax=Enemella evansiae TaxID=2016499 RepID=UPI001061CEF2|nr:ubiquitin-like protein Pup [Enemella evansiae]TDO93122.1 ubiquitin-like protein Pup [Enemella evansiae]